jgi:hypothetical protein
MGRAAGFLARWSRHKQLAAARAREPADTAIPAKPSDTLPVSPEPVEDGPSPSLPPIEALDAGSDITPFLAPGVPAELTRQALRRIWLADPAIRDFVGLAENAWDFTTAGGVPGFGSLSAEDAGRLLTRTLGAVSNADARGEESAADRRASDGDCDRAGELGGEVGTAQDFDEAEINRPPLPHSHGGALPK